MQIIYGTQLSSQIVQLATEAQSRLILVTPYFEPWLHLTTEVRNAVVARKVNTSLIIRGGQASSKHRAAAAVWEPFGVKVFELDRLHAKFYLNEKQALVTSMNLLESSMTGSWEMGVLIDSTKDSEAFFQVVATCKQMDRQIKEQRAVQAALPAPAPAASPAPARVVAAPADAWTQVAGALAAAFSGQLGAATVAEPAGRKARSGTKAKSSAGAWCIRCQSDLKPNPARPLCRSCYAEWAAYANENYPEAFCHLCGGEHKTSVAKPVCRSCFARAKSAAAKWG